MERKLVDLRKYKVFTLEDMKKAFNGGWVQRHNEEGSHYKNMEILIQSIQQPTEIEVTFNLEEKDSEGYLILTKI
jgi:hypothetical protein